MPVGAGNYPVNTYVSGGLLFLAVPAYFAVGVIMGELAIIGAIYSAGAGGGNGGGSGGN